MPPPTQPRNDRTQANGATRSRMYSLAGHAHSSGSLLPRSTDVHAASTSAATSATAINMANNRAVDASDAPYLTNLESHFGRVTLTAPDNLLRRQAAKEKKHKLRQKKAQNAQAAAAALAGATQNALTSSVGRNAAASSSNLLVSSRRYHTTLDDAPVGTGLLLPSPAQHTAMRRAYSGNQTPTLASTSHLQTPPSTTTTWQRRTRQSAAARQESSRPASRASGITSLHRQNVWNDITEADTDDLPPPFPEGAPRPPTPPLPPTHAEAANDAQLIGPQPHARIPTSPPPPFVSDDEHDSPPRESQEETTVSRPSSRASTDSVSATSGDQSVELTQERRAWEADIQNGLSFEVRMLREQQRRVARERAAALRARAMEEQYESAEEGATDDEQSAHVVAPATVDAQVETEAEAIAAVEADQPLSAPIVASQQTAAPPADDGALTEQDTAEQAGNVQVTTEQPARPLDSTEAPSAETPSLEPVTSAALPSPNTTSQPESQVSQFQIPSAAPAQPEQPCISAAPVETDTSGRRMLANEPRLGLPPMSSNAPAPRRPVSAQQSSSSAAPRRILGHRKTNSDPRPTDVQAASASSNRASLSGLIGRRLHGGQAVRGHDSDSHLPLSRRPEDTLYVISAPPPAVHDTSSSEGEVVAPHMGRGEAAGPVREDDAVGDASAALNDEDDGAGSDSSIEQWLSEAAAFDALRKREEEAAARLEALREPPFFDSDGDDTDQDVMPESFTHASPTHRRQVNAARKVPDPANLALMDQALPKAPPLVLGRSRGGAAFSDSSSDSTDTDELLDQYSSSDEDDEQHRAFRQASTRDTFGGGQGPANDPFVNFHKPLHAHNTSSAPNLSILDDNVTQSSVSRRSLAPVPRPKSGSTRIVEAQSSGLDAPTRSLSLKAKGKLPERDPAPTAQQQPDTRAGEFEEDTSSSRDLSDADDITASFARLAASLPTSAPLGNGNDVTHRHHAVSLTKTGPPPLLASMVPPSMSGRRASLDPLLQPLGYGRTDVGNRLKGLFGQSLVDGPSSQMPASLSARAAAAAATQALPSDALEGRRPLSGPRRLSSRSERETEAPAVNTVRRTSDAVKAELSTSQDAPSRRDDNVSMASSRASTLRRKSSAESKAAAAPSASSDMARPSSSSSSMPPEQKARDEALAQIAQLNATSQRQNYLAALERLLAKIGRPTSMLPPSAMSRAELGGRLEQPTDVASSASQVGNNTASVTNERPPPPTNHLSRSGAIIRNCPEVPSRGPLPSPPSALSRAASTTRPVSFVNPRSSAAPLPRGRLPAITDATRHFPPSASAGPGVAPSWLSYIPSEERERLPAPLEPQRLGARAPGSRVSAMISRFEAPSHESQTSGSTTKQTAPEFGRMPASESNQSNTSNAGGGEGMGQAEPAVFRRFSRTQSSGSADGNIGVSGIQRRPPPPPPTLPSRRTYTNPFRRSENSNDSHVPSSSSIEALAREIEETASGWMSESLHRPSSQVSSNARAYLLAPPTTAPSAVQGGPLRRSPRTQAMDSLTGREHDPSETTPPMRPPKSPLITPEQILASGSRNGLGASIAAAQAAAFARRDGRHSNSSSFDAQVATRNNGAEEGDLPRSNSGAVRAQPGARPLPALPNFVRGLGISGDEARNGGGGNDGGERAMAPPPPLPTRPRDRVWEEVGSGSGSVSGASGSGVRRMLPSIPTARSVSGSGGTGQNGRRVPVSTAGISLSQAVSSSPTVEGTSAIVSTPSTSTTNAPPAAAVEETTLPTTITTAASRPAVEGSSTNTRSAAHRDGSLGLTDFDLLVASLDHPSSGGRSYDRLCAISDFLGPAKGTSLSASQLSSLSVGMIECDSRRVTKEGKVKQKLSCVGVRVDKCPICIAQFREGQRAVILNCGHIMHEVCGRELFRRTDRCGVCRTSAA
ncbi:hypothetical protein NDA18_003667 [Ustilago nuda]|nr:hypothetical protein NDA18_003667 [Ustilago nuda]